MPKKTKKEKLLAQRHRHNLPLSEPSEIQKTEGGTPVVSYRLNVSATARQPARAALVSTEEFAAIKKDLIKTALITAGIIIGEFLLAQRLPH